MGIGIHTQTLVVKHSAIRALPSTNEENQVVLRGKLRDIRHAVGHITTDGIETLEGRIFRDVRLDVVDDTVELVERLCGLRIQIDVSREIELSHLVKALYDNGCALGLTYKAKYLGMTFLTKNHNLSRLTRFVVLLFDTLLELEYHRTRSIDNLDVVTTGQLVGLRGFTMGTEQHLGIMEFAHVIVVDDDKAHLTEALALHTIMNDIAQAVELGTFSQLFLGFLYGGGHSEAESTAVVDFYLKHN